jgi:hypothetical protein
MRLRFVRFPLGLLAGLLLIAVAREAAAETWKLYVNARYGTVAEYPADRFRPGHQPANGDGQRFTAKACLLACSIA